MTDVDSWVPSCVHGLPLVAVCEAVGCLLGRHNVLVFCPDCEKVTG